MYKLRKVRCSAILAGVMMAFGMCSANAVLVDFTLQGTVDSADAGNIFNVVVGSNITATGSFDNSLLAGGIEGAVTGTLITVGDLTFDNNMDTGGGALITLNSNGTLNDFTYTAREGQLGALADFDSFFTGFTGANTVKKGGGTTYTIAGTWGALNVTTVPVPAAVWLFGSGLIGLAGVARRKAA